MKHVYTCSYSLLTIMILTGFTSEQSTHKEGKLQKTNFSGTLTTHTGQKNKYQVENISIGNLISNIRFFELPALPAGILSEDPHTGAVFEINLEKGLILEVPSPGKLWSYKRNEKASKVEYVEIVVIPCDKGDKKRYIVETTRHLFCQELGACDPIAMKIPLTQIKKLTIKESMPWKECRQCPVRTQEQRIEEDALSSAQQD